MKSLFRNCIYQGKNLFREKNLLFWTLIYPIIMAVFFYTGFSGIINVELEKIQVGIDSNNPIIFILDDIDLLNINKMTEDEGNTKLQNEEIHGFIDKDLNLLVGKSGINQSIIKEILDQIKQAGKLNRPMENLDFSKDYVLDRNQNANGIIIIFYSLIGMVSTYGLFSGIETVSLIQANLTNLGKRLNSTPLKKSEFLMAGIIVSLTLNLLANGLLVLFIQYALKVNLLTEIKYSLIFIILGNIFGVALGVFIGVSNKQSANVKVLISLMITLFSSFISGMMAPNVKVLIDKNMSIVGRLNPISIMTNNLYRINLLEITEGVREGIIVLSIYSLILIAISYVFLRRKTYDSI